MQQVQQQEEEITGKNTHTAQVLWPLES